jgi:glycerate 2-kinase
MRQRARHLFDAAVSAADPERAVSDYLTSHPFGDAFGGKTYVIAFGKAAPAMARAALDRLERVDAALVVTHHENMQSVPSAARLLKAGHPVPDQAGADAAREVIDLLASARAGDLILALVSGGASALLPAPAAGISLADKQRLNALLLESGLDIVQMNLVRQQVSELKGGGLSAHAAPAEVTALILSDVIGDDLRAIASGPTVSALGTAGEARQILEDVGVWADVPASIQAHLNRAEGDATPAIAARNAMVGSNRKSLDAMVAAEAGARIITDHLVGDVEAAALVVAEAARSAETGACILLFGGETTVRLTGTGRGGRNQELSLHVAKALDGLERPWLFLSGGTDGRDGPTDAAGGIVDAGTLGRAEAAGVDTRALLANNDSYAVLAAAGDLLMTEATGTNVADVQVLILG